MKKKVKKTTREILVLLVIIVIFISITGAYIYIKHSRETIKFDIAINHNELLKLDNSIGSRELNITPFKILSTNDDSITLFEYITKTLNIISTKNYEIENTKDFSEHLKNRTVFDVELSGNELFISHIEIKDNFETGINSLSIFNLDDEMNTVNEETYILTNIQDSSIAQNILLWDEGKWIDGNIIYSKESAVNNKDEKELVLIGNLEYSEGELELFEERISNVLNSDFSEESLKYFGILNEDIRINQDIYYKEKLLESDKIQITILNKSNTTAEINSTIRSEDLDFTSPVPIVINEGIQLFAYKNQEENKLLISRYNDNDNTQKIIKILDSEEFHGITLLESKLYLIDLEDNIVLHEINA